MLYGSSLSGYGTYAGVEGDVTDETDTPTGVWWTQSGFGVAGLRGFMQPEFISALISEQEFGEEFVFEISTLSREFLGFLRLDIQHSDIAGGQFSFSKNGSDEISLNVASFPEYTGIYRIRALLGGVSRFAGTIAFPEILNVENPLEIRGQGWRKEIESLQLEGIADGFRTAGLVVTEIVEAYVLPDSGISTNLGRIDRITGPTLAGNVDISKSNLIKIMDFFSSFADCDWGIDADEKFFFTDRSDEIADVWYAGYDAISARIKKNISTVVNYVIIQRQPSKGSGGTGWIDAAVAEDTASQTIYGKKKKQILVPGYYTDTDCQAIANAYITRYAYPSESIEFITFQKQIKRLVNGIHKIVMPPGKWAILITDGESTTGWAKIGSGDMAIGLTDEFIVSGAAAIDLSWTNALNDRAEYTTDFASGRIRQLKFWMRCNTPGVTVQVGVGENSWDDFTFSLDPALEYQPYVIDIDLEEITHLRKFAVKNLTADLGSEVHLYIDRVEVVVNGFRNFTGEFTRAIVNIDPDDKTIQVELGEIPPRVDDYIIGLERRANEARFAGEIR